MAEKLTQKTVEQPQKKPEVIPDYVSQAEKVRVVLGVNDEQMKENWPSLMQYINSGPSDPSKIEKGGLVKTELERRYEDISRDRQLIAKMLLAFVTIANANRGNEKTKQFSIKQEAMLRLLARYVEDRDIYEHMYQGQIPTGSPFLNYQYLAKFVDTRETEDTAVAITENMLPMQYDVKKTIKSGISPRILALEAMEMTRAAVRLDLKMDNIMSCLDSNGKPVIGNAAPYELLLQTSGFKKKDDESWPQETLESAEFLVGYIAKNLDDIKKYAEIHVEDAVANGKDKLSFLTVGEALECCAQSSMMGQLAEEVASNAKGVIRQNIGDMRGFLDGAFNSENFIPERLADVVLAPPNLKYMTPQERKDYQVNARVVLDYFRKAKYQSSIGRVDTFNKSLTKPQQDLIHMVIQKLAGTEINAKGEVTKDYAKETIERLKRVTFMNEDPEEETNKKIIAKLTDLIEGKKIMTRDALDLYYLMNIKGGDVLLAYKTVSLLRKYNEPSLAIELQMRLLSTLTDFALTKDPDDVKEKLTEMGFDEKNQLEMENMRLYIAESGVDAIGTVVEETSSFIRNFPRIASVIGLYMFGGVTTSLVLRSIRTWRVETLQSFADNKNVNDVREQFNIDPSIKNEVIIKSQNAIKIIFRKIKLLHLKLHMPFESGRLLARGMNVVNAARAGKVADMALSLKRLKIGVYGATDMLFEMTDNKAEIQAALEGAGYKPKNIEKAIKKTTEKKAQDGVSNFNPTSPDAQPDTNLQLSDTLAGLQETAIKLGIEFNPTGDAKADKASLEAQIKKVRGKK